MADETNLVNSWFTANPNASQADAAAAVQSIGGLTPDLASALATHYGTTADVVNNAYTQLTAPTSTPTPTPTPTPVNTASSPLSSVSASTPTPISTTPTDTTPSIFGLSGDVINTDLTNTGGQQALYNFFAANGVTDPTQISQLLNSNLGTNITSDQVAQYAPAAANTGYYSNPTTSVSAPTTAATALNALSSGMSSTDVNNVLSGAAKVGTNASNFTAQPDTTNVSPTPYSSSTAYATNPQAGLTSDQYTQTYNAIQLGNTHVIQNGTDDSGNPTYALVQGNSQTPLPATITPNGDGTYIVSTGSTGGQMQMLVGANPETGNILPIFNYNQQVGYQKGSSGAVINQLGQAISSFGPLGSIAVTAALNYALPGAGSLGATITGAAADSTLALTVGGATIGATTGAIMSAINGGDITKGALTGALTGGVASNAANMVNSVINPTNISKSINGIYTPTQVTNIVSNSLVRAVSSAVSGKDTSQVLTTFLNGLVANGLGTSASNQIVDQFKNQGLTDATLAQIGKTVGSVANAASTSLLNGGNSDAVNTAIISSLANSAGSAIGANAKSTSTSGTSTSPLSGTNTSSIDLTPGSDFLNQLSKDFSTTLAANGSASSAISGNSGGPLNYTPQQSSDMNYMLKNFSTDPNSGVSKNDDGSYSVHDYNNNISYQFDANGNPIGSAFSVQMNLDGDSQSSTSDKARAILGFGNVNQSTVPMGNSDQTSKVVANFADLNPDQQSKTITNIADNLSNTSGTASFIPESSPGVWQLPFNVIGHTTDSGSNKNTDVYEDNSGNKWTLIVTNGQPTQVPFDPDSSVPFYPNDKPVPVTTNVDPNKSTQTASTSPLAVTPTGTTQTTTTSPLTVTGYWYRIFS